MTLICHLNTNDNFCCDRFVEIEKIELTWVNQAGIPLQTDSRYHIITLGQFSSILTTTLLNEDNNTEWTCQVNKGNAVKASTSFTVKYIGEKPNNSNFNMIIMVVFYFLLFYWMIYQSVHAHQCHQYSIYF